MPDGVLSWSLAVSGWTPHPRTYDNTLHRGLAIVHGAHKALAIKAAKSRPARFVLRMKGRFLTTLAAEKGSRGGLQGAGAWQPGRTRTRYLDTLDRPSPRPPNRYLDTPSRVPQLYLVPQIPQSSEPQNLSLIRKEKQPLVSQLKISSQVSTFVK